MTEVFRAGIIDEGEIRMAAKWGTDVRLHRGSHYEGGLRMLRPAWLYHSIAIAGDRMDLGDVYGWQATQLQRHKPRHGSSWGY